MKEVEEGREKKWEGWEAGGRDKGWEEHRCADNTPRHQAQEKTLHVQRSMKVKQ